MPIPAPLFSTGQNLAYDHAAKTVPVQLTDHARTMAQGIYQVADGFYVAVGYGNANLTMVVGTDGIILIDSLETEEAARQALGDLRTVSDKPIKALVYSHSHPDHSSGARGLLNPAEVEQGHVGVYAHERLVAGMRGNPSLGLVPPLRLAYSFGFDLERGPVGLVEVGLGPMLHTGTTGFLPPTTVVHGSLDIQVAGINMHLHEVPSESDDELVVWFPDLGVLHVADVVQGETVPNLYALRGAVRDPWQWIRALDHLRSYDAHALLFGHGRPLTGQDEVRDLLVAYRDALQYIHDQTVRHMARGLTPDDLVEAVAELPPHLRAHLWLGEFYGTVKQTVRQIYANYFGWFEGDPTFLNPLSRRERAARYVTVMGGRDAVLAMATHAYEDGEFQWAAEVVTHVLRLNSDDSAARQLKAEALRQLAYQTTNPIWRNNYLMAAKEIDGTLNRTKLIDTLRALGNPDVTAAIPIPLLLHALATRLDPVKSEGIQLSVGFRCPDTGTTHGLAVRSVVAEVLAIAPPDATVEIHTSESSLRGLLSGRTTWPHPIEDGTATINGGTIEEAALFWSLFDLPVGGLPALALR